MKAIEKRIVNLEAQCDDVPAILIAVSPGESNEEALARSAKHSASIEGRTVYFVHTGVPRLDARAAQYRLQSQLSLALKQD